MSSNLKTAGHELADLADMEADALRGLVASLAGRVAQLEEAVDQLRETPQDPSVRTRAIPRALAEPGEELLATHRNLALKLRRLREEHRRVDAAYDRVREELRTGGRPFPEQPHPHEDELRGELEDLNEELGQRYAEVQAAEAELEEIERELRDFVVVHTHPLRVTRDLEVQA